MPSQRSRSEVRVPAILRRLLDKIEQPVVLLAPDLGYLASSAAFLRGTKAPLAPTAVAEAMRAAFPELTSTIAGKGVPEDSTWSAEVGLEGPEGGERLAEARVHLVDFASDGRPVVLAATFAWKTDSVEADGATCRDKELELLRERDRAEAETRSKTMFLANMSHEIRTPLNALVGMSHLLARMELGPRQRMHAEKIQTAGLALQTLVDDILDYTRIEVGRLELHETDFRLGEVLRIVEAVLGEKARTKGVSLVLESDPELVGALRGDSIRLGQVLINLAGNAVKFTSKGDVEVECRIVERSTDRVRVRFSVTDSGIGMDSEQLRGLFQPFHQADGSITRRYGGAGLGLSIARKLVEIMGGRLSVESAPGVGSVFHFEIWLGTVVEPLEEPTSLGDWDSRGSSAPLLNQRILLVEDDPMNREIEVDLLAAEGANVLPAAHGQQALSILAEEHGDFDLVLLDIEMPVMDGIATVRRMKEDPVYRRIPVVAMTAHPLGDEWQAWRDAGIVDHVQKPFQLSVLCDTILRWTDGSGTADSSAELDADGAKSNSFEIDRSHGMKRIGDGRVYSDVLLRFTKEQGSALGEISLLVERNERSEARSKARALRSASGIIGAVELQKRARVLELALSTGEDVSKQLASVQRCFDRVVKEILELVEKGAAAEATPDAPAPGEEELNRLLDHLRHSAGESIDLYEELSPGLRTWLGPQKAGALDAAMRGLDFDRAVRIIEGARQIARKAT